MVARENFYLKIKKLAMWVVTYF